MEPLRNEFLPSIRSETCTAAPSSWRRGALPYRPSKQSDQCSSWLGRCGGGCRIGCSTSRAIRPTICFSAGSFVTDYLNLVHQSLRRRSAGVSLGGWALDSLAIRGHGVVTIDFERFLIADKLPPKQQAKELRKCLNASPASLLHFRDDVRYLLGPLPHIAPIWEEWHPEFCYKLSIGCSAENVDAPAFSQRFLSLILTSCRLTTSPTVPPKGWPAGATISELPDL